MNNIAISAQNISKLYRLGEVGTGTLSHDLNRWFAKVRGKEDPYSRVAETNDRTVKSTSDFVWSLRDIDFDIKKGDSVGLIGRNGAGKSTLLKILSRVTAPTTGMVRIKGRVASLLEVGTGFNPELTGRENIYLNGAILGMRKSEIRRRFDEIVSFAGVERYVDTPVKRYSSGMYVRLAFAVAAHLESEILIVDEVLAVGDAEFQSKCLGKMSDVNKGEGRTVLFVSHNMGSIAQLCNSAILMNNGKVQHVGKTDECIELYLNSRKEVGFYDRQTPKTTTYIKSVYIENKDNETPGAFSFDEDIWMRIEVRHVNRIPDLTLSVIIYDNRENAIFSDHLPLADSTNQLSIKLPAGFLLPGNYYLSTVLHIPNIQFVDKTDENLIFKIEDSGGKHTPYSHSNIGSIASPLVWEMVR